MTHLSRLHIIEDNTAKRSVEITGTATIGRAIESDIVVDETTVSRRHALLSAQPEGGLVLIDLGSTNGSFVNGVQVPPDELVWLADGDVITLGRAMLRYNVAVLAMPIEAH